MTIDKVRFSHKNHRNHNVLYPNLINNGLIQWYYSFFLSENWCQLREACQMPTTILRKKIDSLELWSRLACLTNSWKFLDDNYVLEMVRKNFHHELKSLLKGRSRLAICHKFLTIYKTIMTSNMSGFATKLSRVPNLNDNFWALDVWSALGVPEETLVSEKSQK